jgi:transporter family-2 protein
MKGRSTDWLLALAGGSLLALMINFNSLLAKHTTPIFASWVAHAFGAVASLCLVALSLRKLSTKGVSQNPQNAKSPFWFYLGGIPGALTVVLAAVTVNSSLKLAGSISLMLVGQVVFGILSDYFGLFGIPKRKIVTMDFIVALSVLSGSALIIFGRP